MASLIDDATKWWNVEKFRRTLPPQEAEDVLKIMINLKSKPDCLIWEHEKNVTYRVSAYRFFHALGQSRQVGECSDAKE